MNKNLNFWKGWSIPNKAILGLVITCFLFLMALALFYMFYGLSQSIHWDQISELRHKIINTPAFTDGTFQFSQNSLVYYIKTHFLPSIIEVNSLSYYLYLGAICVSVCLIAAALVKQKKFGFLLGLLAIAGLLVAFRLENVFLVASNNPFLISFGLVGLAYYLFGNWFNSINTSWVFLALLSLIGLVLGYCYFKGAINFPFLALSAYALPAGVIIFLIFTFLIGHQLAAGISSFVSKNSQKGRSSFMNLLLFALLFVSNCVLIYLENSKYISESSYIMNPIYLWFAACFLGFWANQTLLDNKVSNTFLYIGMALGSVAVLVLAFGTANDSLIELIKDIISVFFLALSIGFFAFVLLNFFGPLKQGLPFYKVIDKPIHFRWILVQGAALFVAILLMGGKNLFSYHQFKAASFNAIGDFYLEEGDLAASEVYFKEALTFDMLSHKANYSLGSLAMTAQNKDQANFYFKQATKREASAFAFAGLAENLLSEDRYFEGWFELREGIEKLPYSTELLTNAAYTKERGSSLDSVFIYLNDAHLACKTCLVPQTNLEAFWIENANLNKLDSATSDFNGLNKSAIAKMALKTDQAFVNPDSLLTIESFANFYNYGTLMPEKLDLDYVNTALKQEDNFSFFKDLNYMKALGLYAQNQKVEGIKLLNVLSREESTYGKMLSQQVGMWFLNEGVYDQATEAFNRAGDSQTVSLLESKSYKEKISENLKLQADNLNDLAIKDALNKAPLNPYLLEKYTEAETNKTKAYKKVFEALEVNGSSIALLKQHSLLALELGLEEYAATSKVKLSNLMDTKDYALFLDRYKEVLAKKKQERDLF